IAWPKARGYPDFIRSLDPRNPRDIAMMTACTMVLRGAGYVAFDGAVPEHSDHAALAAQYTHATAPLRRLGDRHTGEVCLALSAGTPVPPWVLEALPGLPSTMQTSSQRAGRYENAVLDLAEAIALAPHVGETFEGAVVEVDDKDPRRGDLMLAGPAILARIESDTGLPLGERVRARLVEADPDSRRIRFEFAGTIEAEPDGF